MDFMNIDTHTTTPMQAIYHGVRSRNVHDLIIFPFASKQMHTRNFSKNSYHCPDVLTLMRLHHTRITRRALSTLSATAKSIDSTHTRPAKIPSTRVAVADNSTNLPYSAQNRMEMVQRVEKLRSIRYTVCSTSRMSIHWEGGRAAHHFASFETV